MENPGLSITITMENFAAIVDGYNSLTIVAKHSIPNVCRGPGNTSAA